MLIILDNLIFAAVHKKPYGKRYDPCDQSKYKHFTSIDMAIKWAREYYSDWSKKYEDIYGPGNTNDLINYMESFWTHDPIRNYCGYGSLKLNGYLRKTSRIYIDQSNYNDALVTLLLFAPRIPENVVVYRYVPDIVIKAILKENKAGHHYTDNGFMSCSLLFDPKDKEFFNYKNVLELHVDKHTVGAYVNLIQGCERYEYELLILRNAQMFLIDYPYERENRMVYPMRLRNITDSISPFFS